MNVSKVIAASVMLFGIIVVIVNLYPGSSSARGNVTGMQDVRILDRRISLLEQRLYSIESNINRLEQSVISQRSPSQTPNAADREVYLLREDLNRLSQRLSEIECGLLRLDERTAIPSGNTRRPTGAKDACRLNPSAPLQLSTRP
ncbi:MAG TPA: hypothetical protein VF074_03200 [Pyrinomonadaceae bacterium]